MSERRQKPKVRGENFGEHSLLRLGRGEKAERGDAVF